MPELHDPKFLFSQQMTLHYGQWQHLNSESLICEMLTATPPKTYFLSFKMFPTYIFVNLTCFYVESRILY